MMFNPLLKKLFYGAINGLLLLIALLLAVFAAEQGLRAMDYKFELYPSEVQVGWPDPISLKRKYEPDPELLWVKRRYQEILQQGRGQRLDIVFMGDSCTEFGRYDDSFADSVLTQTDQQLKFINVGAAGWSSYQGLQQFKRDILPLKPRIVTLYYGWNDHWQSFGIEDKQLAAFNLEQESWWLDISYLRVVQLVNQVLFGLRFDVASQQRPARVSLVDYEHNLQQIISLAKQAGIQVVLFTAASNHVQGQEPEYLKDRWLTDISQLVPLHQQYVAVTRRIAEQQQVPLLDLAKLFADMQQNERDLYFLLDGIHLTEAGNQKIAEVMFDYFQQQHLL